MAPVSPSLTQWRVFPSSQPSLTRRELATVSNEAAESRLAFRKKTTRMETENGGPPVTHSFWNHHVKVSCCTSEVYHFGWRDQTFWRFGQVLREDMQTALLCRSAVVVKRCYKFIVQTMVYHTTGSWRWKQIIHQIIFWCPTPSMGRVSPGVGRHSRSPGAFEGKWCPSFDVFFWMWQKVCVFFLFFVFCLQHFSIFSTNQMYTLQILSKNGDWERGSFFRSCGNFGMSMLILGGDPGRYYVRSWSPNPIGWEFRHACLRLVLIGGTHSQIISTFVPLCINQ